MFKKLTNFGYFLYFFFSWYKMSEKKDETIPIACDMSKIPANMQSDLDLSDDFGLRHRHTEIYNLVNNDEILFLMTNVYTAHKWLVNSEDYSAKSTYGYGTTGATVISRGNRNMFRRYFLENYEEERFALTTLENFLKLGRRFVFNIGGEEMIFKYKYLIKF